MVVSRGALPAHRLKRLYQVLSKKLKSHSDIDLHKLELDMPSRCLRDNELYSYVFLDSSL